MGVVSVVCVECMGGKCSVCFECVCLPLLGSGFIVWNSVYIAQLSGSVDNA